MTPSISHDLVLACVTSALVSIAAWCDLTRRIIPNLVNLPILCAAPLVHGFASGPGALGQSLLGCALCAAVPYLAFARGGMGGGDVKLFAALGALHGGEVGLQIEVLALGCAALYAAVLLAWRGGLLQTLRGSLRIIAGPPLTAAALRASSIPLAPAIAVAACVVAWARVSLASQP
jgi:prepilin peptidase CpaA